MVCPTTACAACTRNCLLTHGKNKYQSSSAISFFKVMIGDDYSTIMFLPPIISRTASELINHTTQLEDATGKRWTVTVSKCDGYLAFQQGWRTFSLEHSLEPGDFVVFHYIMGSHFVVQIYGKSACEKLNFSQENGCRGKRRRTHSTDSDSMNKHGSNTSAVSGSKLKTSPSPQTAADKASKTQSSGLGLDVSPRTVYAEEPFYMIDRDSGQRQQDERISLFDLSNFETHRTSSVLNRTDRVLEDERSPCSGNKMLASQAEVDKATAIQMTEQVVSRRKLAGTPDMEVLEQNEKFCMMENVSEKDSTNGKTSGLEQKRKTRSSDCQSLISQKEDALLMQNSAIRKQKFAEMSELSVLKAPVETQKYQSEERIKVVKQEHVEMSRQFYGIAEECPEIGEFNQSDNPALEDKNLVPGVVKAEPVDPVEFCCSDAVKNSFSVVMDKPFFVELPDCLPSVSWRARPRMARKAVVCLRDPVSRLWPVIYNEMNGLQVFSGGWAAFAYANRIQPGDECVFQIENTSECTYRVGLNRLDLSGVARRGLIFWSDFEDPMFGAIHHLTGFTKLLRARTIWCLNFRIFASSSTQSSPVFGHNRPYCGDN